MLFFGLKVFYFLFMRLRVLNFLILFVKLLFILKKVMLWMCVFFGDGLVMRGLVFFFFFVEGVDVEVGVIIFFC